MKIAVVLLAGTEGPDGMGRMANALMTALEAQDAGDETRVIFDGAGGPAAGRYRAHPSVRGLLADGFQVVTF